MEAIRIEAPFTLYEVKAVVWACGGEKAKGSDRFTLKFIKNYWDTICDYVMRFVRHFKESGTLGHGRNSLFITLAPKVKDPSTLNEYHPI